MAQLSPDPSLETRRRLDRRDQAAADFGDKRREIVADLATPLRAMDRAAKLSIDNRNAGRPTRGS